MQKINLPATHGMVCQNEQCNNNAQYMYVEPFVSCGMGVHDTSKTIIAIVHASCDEHMLLNVDDVAYASRSGVTK